MACSKFLKDQELEEITAHLSERKDDLEADDSESDANCVCDENINEDKVKDVGEQETRWEKVQNEEQIQGDVDGASKNTSDNLKKSMLVTYKSKTQ